MKCKYKIVKTDPDFEILKGKIIKEIIIKSEKYNTENSDDTILKKNMRIPKMNRIE